MITRIFFVPTLFLFFGTLYCQQTTSLSGSVLDNTSKGIPKASVYILNSNLGTVTGEDGKFQLVGLRPGKYQLIVSAIGYATFTEEINSHSSTTITIVLSDANHSLDEVIVSAQKKEELMQSLPFSVSALSSEKIMEYGLWKNKDLTAIIPNLYSSNPGDDRNVTSLRGITTTSYDPAVTTYIDGVNQFSLDIYIPQLFDVERIEILRGPQGTLYGRNAMGGVINILTRAPGNQTSGFAELSFGNYNQQRLNLALHTPIVKEKLFFGASTLYNSWNGFYTNDYNNSHFDKQYSITGNYYLKFQASKKWLFSLNVKHHANRNKGPFSLVNGVNEAFSNPFHLNQNATTKMVDNTINASLSINYKGSAVNFTSQTAWQTNLRYYQNPIDGDFSPLDGITIINNYGRKWNHVKALTQEFRFVSPASISSPWKWTTGIYLFYQDIPNKQATHFGENGDLMGAAKNTSVITTSRGKGRGMAFFGQVTYQITKQLEITGGLRYDAEHKSLNVLSQYQVDPDPNPVFDIRPDTSAGGNFSSFSPKISFSYKISGKNNIYTTYSRGFRSGGFTPITPDPSQPPLFKFKPEYSNNYELGSKNEFFNNRLRFNIALFYTQVSNAQVPVMLLPDAVTITKNAGNLLSKGVETELAVTPAKGLSVNYNFGYTHAKYTSSVIFKKTQNGDEINLEDKQQVFTPRTTTSFAIQYSYLLNEKKKLKLVMRGEWSSLGAQYFDLANSIRQQSYSLFNSRIGISTNNFEIMLWGRNLADKKYISYAYDFGAVHLGDPRTYGITLRGMF